MEKVNFRFKLIIDQIKSQKENRNNKIAFKNYYLKNKDDNRNNFAKIFDYLIWRIIIFFTLFLFFIIKTKQLYISVIVTSIVVIILHSIAIKVRNYKLEQMKKQKRRHIASKRVYSEIMNKTTDEMEKYIEKLFSNMGFTQLKFMKSTQRYILLKTLYKDNEIIILFYIYKNDFDVELKEVKEFLYTMTINEIKKGVLITTSDFTKDSYNFTNKLNNNYKLLLINKEQLLNTIYENGLFPKDEEIDEIIESKIRRKRNVWNNYKKAALSKNKIKGYIILSLFLILTAWYTPYILYYIVVASLILALAFITFIFNIIYNFEIDNEEYIDFKQLLNNM